MKNLDLTKSFELYQTALEIIPGASQTGSKRPASFAMGAFPIYLERGQGCHVWDVDGNRYLDYIGALGPITLGYCYPAVDEAVMAQLRKGTILSLMHPLEVEAAKAIIEMVPGAEMVRFLKTGAEGTSAAARIIRAYTGKDVIANSGYHGWLDTWAAEWGASRSKGVPSGLQGSIASFTFGVFEGDKCLEAVMQKNRENLAGIVMEPVTYHSTETGDYLKWVRELADKYQVPLVFDEIVSGFRVAPGGAQEYFGVIPDIAVFAKGISNGFPLAAVTGKREIMKTMADLVISSTYGGETLSLAAVVASLKEYREKNVVSHLWEIGGQIMAGMNHLAEEIGLAMEFVGYPVMSAYRFKYDDPRINTELMTLFLQEMAKRGILFRRGGLLFINYSHGEPEVQMTLDAAKEVLLILLEAYRSGNIRNLLVTEQVSEGIRRFS